MTNEQAFKIGRVLANAVTTYDRKQENRRGYNRYALPQYLEAVSRIEESLKYEGVTWQMAVAENFTDRLMTVCVKAIEAHPELLACTPQQVRNAYGLVLEREEDGSEFDRINISGPYAHPTEAK